jgi:hypothetical protein
MVGTDDADDNRLAGRMPKAPRREATDQPAPVVDDEADVHDDQEIEAVNRLMGFLRRPDEA